MPPRHDSLSRAFFASLLPSRNVISSKLHVKSSNSLSRIRVQDTTPGNSSRRFSSLGYHSNGLELYWTEIRVLTTRRSGWEVVNILGLSRIRYNAILRVKYESFYFSTRLRLNSQIFIFLQRLFSLSFECNFYRTYNASSRYKFLSQMNE